MWTRLLLASALSLACASAHAATMRAVFTGRIIESENVTGVFGVTPGRSLDGMRAKLVFVYDVTRPGVLVDAHHEPGLRYVHASGGEIGGTTSPVLSARITVNGAEARMRTEHSGWSYNLASAYEDVYGGPVSQKAVGAYHYATDATAMAANWLMATATAADELAFPPSPDAPVPLTRLVGNKWGDAWFDFFECTLAKGECLTTLSATGTIDLETIRVSTVPLPPAALLLVSGLGALAWAGRRRAAAA